MNAIRLIRHPGLQQVRRTMAGQAATEFVIVTTVLVPMVLLVALLGKVSDVNQTAVAASRYAAWERTVASEGTKDDSTLNAEVQRRFFERSDVGIQTGEGASGDAHNANPLWNAFNHGRVVTSSVTSVGNHNDRESDAGQLAKTVADFMDNFGSLLSKLKSSLDFDVERRGLVTSTVSVDIAANSFGFEAGNGCGGSNDSFVCLSRRSAILTDIWGSGSPDEVG